jgi:hypothetical protein
MKTLGQNKKETPGVLLRVLIWLQFFRFLTFSSDKEAIVFIRVGTSNGLGLRWILDQATLFQ